MRQRRLSGGLERLETRRNMSFVIPDFSVGINDDAQVIRINADETQILPLANDGRPYYHFAQPSVGPVGDMLPTVERLAPWWPNDNNPPLRIVSVTSPANGSVRIASDGLSVFYTPVVGFTGIDSFEYVVDREIEGKNKAKVS